MVNISILSNKLWYAESDYVAFVQTDKIGGHKWHKWFFCIACDEWEFNLSWPYIT